MGKRFVFAAAACTLAAVLSLCLGAVRLTGPELVQALIRGPQDTAGYILWYVRLPRTAGCLLAGAALAVSGAVIQGVLNNTLASPSIIGVNAGAGLAVTVCCALGALSGWVIAGAAFLGAFGAALLIVTAARKTGASRATVILGGVAVNAFLGAISESIRTLVPETAMLAGDFRVGGFSSVSYLRLIPAGLGIVLGMGALFSLSADLDVLSLGEETAQGLGLRVRRTRTVLIMLSALLAGAAVSFGGLLGFVGLMVPHGVRRFCSSRSRFLLPMCALCGAAFVTCCDLAARLVLIPYELPVGILLSLLGGPFFLMILRKRKGGTQDA